MGREPTLGEILATAFEQLPPAVGLGAETVTANAWALEVIAGQTLAGAVANHLGVTWDSAWHYITHVPDKALQALVEPQGWQAIANAFAAHYGGRADPLPVTVH
jgi:hypothetical protein